MKSNLQQLQEQMKKRLEAQQKTVQIVVKKPDGTRVVEDRLQCSTPDCTRVCRKGKLYCSRCTQKGNETKLRDPLLQAATEAGIVERQTSRTGDEEDILEIPASEKRPMFWLLPTNKTEEDSILDLTEEPKQENIAQKHVEQITELFEKHDNLILTTQQKYYTRKHAAEVIGTSPSSIIRWEKKGAVPPPKKLAHNGQCVYTDEDIEVLKKYLSTAVISAPQNYVQSPREKRGHEEEETQETQNPGTFNLTVSKIKKLGKGNSTNKRLNNVVASKLGRLHG